MNLLAYTKKLDKKELAELLGYLYQIILEGRALGAFVILGFATSKCNGLKFTALRESNSLFYLVLGNSGKSKLKT